MSIPKIKRGVDESLNNRRFLKMTWGVGGWENCIPLAYRAIEFHIGLLSIEPLIGDLGVNSRPNATECAAMSPSGPTAHTHSLLTLLHLYSQTGLCGYTHITWGQKNSFVRNTRQTQSIGQRLSTMPHALLSGGLQCQPWRFLHSVSLCAFPLSE